MDYSASIHDAEHPAEASPWGNSPTSSPRPNRTTFNPNITAEPPASPFRFPSQTSSAGLPDDGGFGAGETEYRRPDTASTDSVADTAQSTEAQSDAPTPQGDHGRDFAPGDQGPPPPRQGESQQPGHTQHTGERSQQSQEQQQPRRPPQPQFKLQAKITGLERTGRKDPILRFDVHVRAPGNQKLPHDILTRLKNKQTNLPSFRTTQYRDVRRLHSEFIKLADHLISANPEAIVPAVPPALTSAGAGTDEDEARVKALLQRWFNYVCSNEVLMRDDEMVLFVESDFGYSPMVKKKQPATGVRRKILKQFAPPPDDTPELQEARPIVKLFYLGAMDAGHKVDKLVKSRRGRVYNKHATAQAANHELSHRTWSR